MVMETKKDFDVLKELYSDLKSTYTSLKKIIKPSHISHIDSSFESIDALFKNHKMGPKNELINNVLYALLGPERVISKYTTTKY